MDVRQWRCWGGRKECILIIRGGQYIVIIVYRDIKSP